MAIGGNPGFRRINRQNDTFKMADIKLSDVDFCGPSYYTFTMLVTSGITDFAKGQRRLIRSHRRNQPSGSIPVNTGSSQLSSFYVGDDPVSEAIVQIRGDGGVAVPNTRLDWFPATAVS